MRTREFLKKADQGLFDILLNNSRPSNTLCGRTVPGVTKWRFCDVMELGGSMSPVDVVSKVLNFYFDVGEDEILDTKDRDFISFLKHIRNEMDRVSKMNDALKSEPDNDLIEAGIDRLNVFGELTIYYAISKDPREWDAISEVSFGKMYSKLMMDKINGEVQKRYNEIMQQKQERNRRRR